jgi:hypothetical protein
MKTTIHIFNNVKEINARELQLPERMVLSREIHEQIFAMIDQDEPVKLDNSHIWHNQWLHEQGFYIPDFAILENSNQGFYLHQTERMIKTRDETVECSFCHSQYKEVQTTFCVDCLHHYDMDESKLYLLFLRPVSTMNITLTRKAIHIPSWLLDKFNTIQPSLGGLEILKT